MKCFAHLSPNEGKPLPCLFSFATVLVMANLGALIDSVLHPSIPYFDPEHIISAFVYGTVTAILFLLVSFYFAKQQKLERNLRLINRTLEERVEEKTRELMESEAEVFRNEKLAAMSQLCGSVGHELRNPLGVINNAVYYLRTVSGKSDETTAEYLGIIKEEVDTAERIITDLLDFSRTRPPRAAAVVVRELIERSIERCPVPENVTIETEIPVLPKLRTDPVQMKQVLQNLITNAIQAMPQGGTVRIKCERDAAGKNILISFSDSGHGISPEHMKKIFEPLFTTKPRGIGLGLVVSKRLTVANGGRLEVESQPGKGTTFRVVLPL